MNLLPAAHVRMLPGVQMMRPAGQHGSASGGNPAIENMSSSRRIPIQLLLTPVDGAEPSAGNRPSQTQASTYEQAPSNPGASTSEDRRSSLPVQMLINKVNTTSPKNVSLPSLQATLSRSSTLSDETSPMYFRDDPESTWDPTDLTRRPRAPRPSYSEEQKFFIMYARIMRDHSWPEIEDQFAEIFGQRSKGGLTSVYYRVRKDWGLSEVLKSGPGSFAADCREIERRARNFSGDFLTQIGYLEQHA